MAEKKKTTKKDFVCEKCMEVHGRDSKQKIQCPHCNEIVGCFYHDKGTKHIQNCKKKKTAKPKEKKKRGRPTDYTPELGDAICSLLSEGKSLRSVCELDGMPSRVTVFAWMRKEKEFLNQYARAKEESADALIDEIIDIADGAEKIIRSGAEKKSGAYAQSQKLRIDSRKWVASKLKPKKYGDRMDVTSDGKAIKGNTIVFENFGNETESK